MFLLSSTAVYADSVWNTPGQGDWAVGENWNPAGIPDATTAVTIDNGGEAQITTPGQAALSLTIGGAAGASGALTITAGGTLVTSSPTPTIVGGNGTGVITVSRIGSSWINAGGLIVGDGGGSTGTLAIDMGATVTTGTAAGTVTLFGNQAGSTGSLLVDGDGSTFTAGNTLIIGNLGAATMRVSSGALVESAGAVIGAGEGGSGNVTITGANSLWRSTGQMTIGRAGSGSLLIEAGGAVTTDTAIVGLEASGVGVVKISGGGSSWTIADALTLGAAGQGGLTIESGATVTNGTATLGSLSTGVGIAKITGLGSSWTTSGVLTIGGAGQGSLTVEAAGTASAASAVLGAQHGGVGVALVTGDGSGFIAAGTLTIGDAGSGSLTVDAGGRATADDTVIGASAGGTGILLVNGENSSFAASGALTIGGAGTGGLTVVGGATATSASAVVGASSGGNGTVILSGAGSSWTTTGTLEVGASGTGTVGVSLGATMASGDATLGMNSVGSGSVLVTDNGSAWTVDGALDVGGAGTGKLQVAAGGKVTADTATIGDLASGAGNILVTNSGSSLDVDGALAIGKAGTGTLTIVSGGTVASGDATLGADEGGNGTAYLSGSGSDWTSGGMTIGAAGSGTLQVTAAATVESGAAVLGAEATGVGTAWVDGLGSRWSIADDLTIGDAGTGTLTISGEGIVSVDGGTGTVTLAADEGSTGTLVLGNGAGTGAGTLQAAEITSGAGTASIRFDHSEGDYRFDPAIHGTISLTQAGPGITILGAENDYTGDTTVSAGILRAGMAGAFSSASATSVERGGTLDLAGYDQTLASLANSGTVSLVGSRPGTTLAIAGNYSGGGAIRLGADLGGSRSTTDRLVLDGNVSGATRLSIVNQGGSGARTTGSGIEIVSVAGNSPANAFTANRAVAGAWDYRLYQGGVGAAANDGNWYLRSDMSLAAQTYGAYPSTLLAYSLASVGTLRQRTGGWTVGPSQSGLPEGGWVRGYGQWSTVSPGEGSSYDQDLQFGQTGIEAQLPIDNTRGTLSAGVLATIGRSSANVAAISHGETGSGKIDSTAYGFGGTLTWRDKDGLYADALGQLTYYDSSFSASDIGGLGSGNALGFAASLEVGKSFEMSKQWAIIPQAQLVYSTIGIDSFTDRDGSVVDSSAGNSLVGRAGVRVEHEGTVSTGSGAMGLNAYIVANLTYGFLGGTDVAISGTELNQEASALMGELGLGATLRINSRASLYGEASYAAAASSGSDQRWSGNFGFTVQW